MSHPGSHSGGGMAGMISSTVASAVTHIMDSGAGAGAGLVANHDGHEHHMMASTPETDHSIHQGHGLDDGTGHGMMMYFHGGYTETILFEIWKIDSILGLALSMVGLFLVGALYEGLKVYREYLLLRSKSQQFKQYTSVDGFYKPGAAVTAHTNGDTSPTHTNDATSAVNIRDPVEHRESTRSKLLSSAHLLQTFLHMVQVFISYLLMLVFMTYNSWLCLAVVLGAGVGYFAFGWKKSVIGDSNEHCN